MTALASRYRRFAEAEARGRSPLYEAFALAVADSAAAQDFLATLPPERRQPNLLLAAVRHVCGIARDGAHFLAMLLAHTGGVRAVMLTRTTQTNEAGRCATLLPVLARLPQPLALIEVGASAGLCLLPDHYGYDYGRLHIAPPTPNAPTLACVADAATPVPAAAPQIVWRAGLDLNPLDPADADQVAWLETLIWPGQEHRLATLHRALALATTLRPRIVKGDLLSDDLDTLCAEAPKGATLVIFHTAVMMYITDLGDRQRFAERAMALCDTWICSESAGLFPAIAARTTQPPPGRFLMSVNGAPAAWSEFYGSAIDWI